MSGGAGGCSAFVWRRRGAVTRSRRVGRCELAAGDVETPAREGGESSHRSKPAVVETRQLQPCQLAFSLSNNSKSACFSKFVV